MRASIVITTKDRKEELENALSSCLLQVGSIEIIVISDGSTDGTEELVRQKFPQVTLISHNESAGLIARRNEGAKAASGDVIVSIDDDAEFSSPHVVRDAIQDLQRSEKIGAIAIPYLEPNKENQMLQKSPDESIWITDRFIGTSHLLRKDIFLAEGGYKAELVHQGEESDFSVRMLDSGYYVALGTGDHVIHHESPKRDYSRMDFYGARNQLLWAWSNVPLPFLPIQLAGTTVQTIRFAKTLNRSHKQFGGLVGGYKSIAKGFPRSPVSISSYRKFRQLRTKPQRLEGIFNVKR